MVPYFMAKKKQGWLQYGSYINLALSFGIMMIAALFLGFFGGEWLDRRLGTSPIFMILGIIFGAVVGFYSLFGELSGLLKDKPDHEEKQEDDDRREL